MENSAAPTLPHADAGMIKRVSLPLFQARGWLRFLGVMSILEGVLDAVFIVGLIIAWLPIWMGVLLFQAAGDAERGNLAGEASLVESANRRLKTYFILRGVTLLLEIGLAILAISFFSTLGILGLID